MNKIAFRKIFLIWLAWVFIVIGFQSLATARFQPVFPDLAQDWTSTYTLPATYQVNRPYLVEPFMNAQVCWDSEYYLSIAIGGYDDPKVPHLTPAGVTDWNNGMLLDGLPYKGDSVSLNYAFFPFYPWVMWLFAQPLKLIGLNLIATTTLAGVIVSALGALLGMLALYDLTYDTLGEDGAMRAAFYLLIFPTGFFLVQVYTEGLFVGLAFACLALLRRGKWLPAALLGAAATLTRAVGVALIIPMALTWFRTGDWLDIDLEWRQIYYWWRESW
jgi:Gpi18-like mannosyltransferase